jgi:cobalt-precorrin-7 (C5)-methyltransferase|tara:strand:+ start:2546 stop:3244 length:699 start_codon:yes stop_codon:yes gene_type:complete
MGKVFAVGVGPGSQNYITEVVRKTIVGADVIVGHKYTLDIIAGLIQGKKTHIITMKDQEKTYQQVKKELGGGVLVVPFTGDVNFSESEVVDRLIEVFGEVEIIPGISSVQAAASKAKIPLDKSKVITMHVTTPIEEKKLELQKAILDGFNIVLIPRPWPKDPKKHFMPSEVAIYLKKNGFDTPNIPVYVFESLTNGKEQTFVGNIQELEGKEFSDLSVMVISQTKPESYINF